MFNTPWGRYRFVHLPWSHTCAQDIFQWMLDQILEQCKGSVAIADDVIIHGKDNEEHSWNLHRLICVTHKHGLVFNGEKCEVKQDSNSSAQSMTLMELTQILRRLMQSTRCHHQMTLSQHPIPRICYLPVTIHSIILHAAPLQELLKKDSEFI